jgi:hypothetical protein
MKNTMELKTTENWLLAKTKAAIKNKKHLVHC